ncbi:hypothetical protein INT48_008374 [Thamnidium elegans]|uniref:Uncharacterized protein n=1 Tax=Thamnidium elegans TaxID=101142 RepID=A0A8H7VYS9_9FUNG|nr:hypothetical protein INT48_008374 [Thamnidium elegans]
MYHTNARFNRYGGFNKREHIVKFKIRDKATTPSIIGITKAQPVVSCSSSSSSSVDPFDFTHLEKSVIKNLPSKAPDITNKSPVLENDTIFDFPDTEETLEVKLMVASGRAIPEHHKKPKKTKKKSSPVNTPRSSSSSTTTTNTPKKSSQKKKSNKTPIMQQSRSEQGMVSLQQQRQNRLPLQNLLQSQQSLSQYSLSQQALLPHPSDQQQQQLVQGYQESVFDIFDFDYNPQISIRHSSAINDTYGTSYAANTMQPNQTYSSQSYTQCPNLYTQSNSQSNIISSQPASLVSISSLLNDTTSLSQVTEFLNETPKPKPPKRKRNLVSHLKTARGETAPAPNFDFLSDEEDLIPIRDIRSIERSVSPELTYSQRMELELNAMTEPAPISIKSTRAPYRPQNKMNVKFTF